MGGTLFFNKQKTKIGMPGPPPPLGRLRARGRGGVVWCGVCVVCVCGVCVVLCGVVWSGVVWSGVVWCGLVRVCVWERGEGGGFGSGCGEWWVGVGVRESETTTVDMPDAGSQTELGLKSQFPLLTFLKVECIQFNLI